MTEFRIILIVLLIAVPVLWFFWREGRATRPELLWPRLAGPLNLEFSASPPSLSGSWLGRQIVVRADGGTVVATARYRPNAGTRIEIGDREEVERAAGMVVPDRVEFPEDSAFSRRLLVRASPEERGRMAADPNVRRRLMALAGVHVLASSGRADVSLTGGAKESQLREMLDIAVAVADAAE